MSLFARRVNNFDLFSSHAWYVPGVGGMFGLLLWFLLGSLLGGFIQLLLMAVMPMTTVIDYGMIIVYPVSFIPAMLYVARKSHMNSLFEPGYKLSSNNFGPFKWWMIALITVFLSFGTMVAADLPNYWNFKFTTSIPWLKTFYDAFLEAIQKLTGGPFWSSFLVTAIFAPFFEEWLCRGMVLRGLLTKIKPAWAIIISALFFALIHMNPWQALNAFIIGVVMGIVYYRTGNLYLTMLIHFVNNGFAVIMAHIPSVQNYEFFRDMIGNSMYPVVYLLGVLVFAGCLYAFSRIPLKQERGNVDEIALEAEQ